MKTVTAAGAFSRPPEANVGAVHTTSSDCHWPGLRFGFTIGQPSYKKYDSAPIKLQAHPFTSPPISFRNIWVRELN